MRNIYGNCKVKQMNMYQEKFQYKYHTVDEVKEIEKEFEKKFKKKYGEKIAVSLLDILDVETIAQKTNLTVNRVKKLKEKYYKNDDS